MRADSWEWSGFEPIWSPRPSWADAPASLVAWAESALGGPVAAFRDTSGGFSAGFAVRLVGATGRRAFVKAINRDLNEFAASALRKERAVAATLRHVAGLAVPSLRADFDDGYWIALAFDDVDGTNPSWPWSAADLATTLTALGELHDALTPAPAGPLPRAEASMQRHRRRWPLVAENPVTRAALDPWLQANVDQLAERAARARVAGNTVLNLDVRADNVVFDSLGRAWFVDWPWASVGAPHLDAVMLLVNAAVCGHDPEAWLTQSSVAQTPAEDFTDALCLLAGIFAEGCSRPEPPGVRGLRPFQAAHLDAATQWLRRRLN